MKYLVSTISDVATEEENGDWEKLTYIDRTRPLCVENGLGIEIAEFCITDNMEHSFDDVMPHVEECAAAVSLQTLHAPYNELFPQGSIRRSSPWPTTATTRRGSTACGSALRR